MTPDLPNQVREAAARLKNVCDVDWSGPWYVTGSPEDIPSYEEVRTEARAVDWRGRRREPFSAIVVAPRPRPLAEFIALCRTAAPVLADRVTDLEGRISAALAEMGRLARSIESNGEHSTFTRRQVLGVLEQARRALSDPTPTPGDQT